ncbi:MAG: FtsX-like permease family protein, partial [Methanosarcinaceae archaeon]|nr:FtsX-like permease family protein [Methanosarcinaceae archaeon]
RRFIAFLLMYTALMTWMSINLDFVVRKVEEGSIEGWADWSLLVYSILATVILSILYAWIVINYRKQEIATLKCLGYTNGNIRSIIITELMFVTFVAFALVLEFLIHQTAAVTYYWSQLAGANAADYVEGTTPFLGIVSISITLGMFVFSQVIGIVVMYQKILKLRPIVALRVLK